MTHVITVADADADADAHAQAGRLMRQARVELFCDHPASALAAIRRAVSELESPQDGLDAEEILTLERAAWLVRRHEMSAAVSALDAAIGRMSA